MIDYLSMLLMIAQQINAANTAELLKEIQPSELSKPPEYKVTLQDGISGLRNIMEVHKV